MIGNINTELLNLNNIVNSYLNILNVNNIAEMVQEIKSTNTLCTKPEFEKSCIDHIFLSYNNSGNYVRSCDLKSIVSDHCCVLSITLGCNYSHRKTQLNDTKIYVNIKQLERRISMNCMIV